LTWESIETGAAVDDDGVVMLVATPE
jgi:hypothetical protein